MGFFVTSRGVDGSARLGGLDAADAHCQRLARAAGAGDRTWRAYLSIAGARGERPVHARDRIGGGPWFNARGALIARSLDELHGDRHGIERRTALTERGDPAGDHHDVLTGSDQHGRLAFEDGAPATCGDWTTAGAGVARIGHADRMSAASHDNRRFVRWNGSWNSEHATLGCGAEHLGETGGSGQFYCFAADPVPAAPASAPARDRYTFDRGVIVNHWLASNFAPSAAPAVHYGAPWFDEEDVAWIAERGFDHLQIYVGGDHWIRPDGALDERAISHFDDALRWARHHRLGVVLAMYAVPGYRTAVMGGPAPTDTASPFTDPATRADAAYLWWLTAKRYADVGDELRFELLVQPNADTAADLRAYYEEALRSVRRFGADRVVYLTPRGGSIDHVDDVAISDPHVAVSLTFREPAPFVFQWGRPGEPRVTFPGRVPDLATFADVDPSWRSYSNTEWTVDSLTRELDRQIGLARRLAGRREIYISTFGVMPGIDDGSARAYLRTIRAGLDRHRVGWAVYDYSTGGAIRANGTGGATRVVDGLGLGAR